MFDTSREAISFRRGGSGMDVGRGRGRLPGDIITSLPIKASTMALPRRCHIIATCESATPPLRDEARCLCSLFSLLVARHSVFCNGGAYICLHCRERGL